MHTLQIKNLSYSYPNNIIFNALDISFKEKLVAIIGTPSSGKTTLAKILSGDIVSPGLYVDDELITKKNKNVLNKKVGVVFGELVFLANTVKEELSLGLENQGLAEPEISKKILQIMDAFNIIEIIDDEPTRITYEKQVLLKILSYILMDIHTIVIDDMLSHLNNDDRNDLLKYIKSSNLQLINVSSNIEEVLYSEYVYILDKGNVVMEGKLLPVLSEEKLLKRLGLSLPTIVDISLQLKSYGLLKKIYIEERELVGAVWK